jgi:hypothetical protein
LTEVYSNLVENLVDDFIGFLFLVFKGVIHDIVHHLLSLVHHVILSLKLHGDPLDSGKVHIPVHRAE